MLLLRVRGANSRNAGRKQLCLFYAKTEAFLEKYGKSEQVEFSAILLFENFLFLFSKLDPSLDLPLDHRILHFDFTLQRIPQDFIGVNVI